MAMWSAGVEDSMCHRLRIINASNGSREFRITATPFRGTDEYVQIDVPRSTLAPALSLDVRASFRVPSALAGGRYLADVIVSGGRDERIVIELNVKPQQDAVSVVEQ
jgi:hypothetical protein